MDAVHAGGLGGTYGGNPVACAAALAAIDQMEARDLPARARALESIIRSSLSETMDRAAALGKPVIGDVRGRGAMMALELVRPGTSDPNPELAKEVAAHSLRDGVIVLTCGTHGNVLRLLPPLVIGEDLLREALSVVSDAIIECALS